MKIFWSWQSDYSPKTCRHFIKKALEVAIEKLAADLGLEDADRPELDHDTKGSAGMVDIAATLLGKIEASAAFVADVTPVGMSVAGKALPNPNVMVELGWAMARPGAERVIAVLNLGSGFTVEQLPFDIRNRRVLTYNLPDNSDAQITARQRVQLTADLVNALSSSRPKPTIPKIGFAAAQPTTTSPTAYWQPGEVLAEISADSVQCMFGDDTGFYLRVIPTDMMRQIPVAGLLKHMSEVGLPAFARSSPEWKPWANGYGGIRVDLAPYRDVPPISAQPIRGATQVFRSGELWGVNNELARHDGKRLWLPLRSVQTAFVRTLPLYTSFLQNSLSAKLPFRVMMGATGISGSRFIIDDGPFLDSLDVFDDWSFEGTLADAEASTIDELLVAAFASLFALTGLTRPAGYGGFPIERSK